MYSSTVKIETEHASKYLKQLCKHFAHKVQVEYDDFKGHVDFPMGESDMIADDKYLIIQIKSNISEEARRAGEVIIEKHLVKFAWREEVSFDWQIHETS